MRQAAADNHIILIKIEAARLTHKYFLAYISLDKRVQLIGIGQPLGLPLPLCRQLFQQWQVDNNVIVVCILTPAVKTEQ